MNLIWNKKLCNIYESLYLITTCVNNKNYPDTLIFTKNQKKFLIKKGDNNSYSDFILFLLINCHKKKIYYTTNLTMTFLSLLEYTVPQYKIKWTFINNKIYEVKIYQNSQKMITIRCFFSTVGVPFEKTLKFLNLKIKGWKNNPFKINNDIIDLKIIIKAIEINKKNLNLEKNLNNYEKLTWILKLYINWFWLDLKKLGIINNKKMLSTSSIIFYNYFKLYPKTLINKKNTKFLDYCGRLSYFGGRCEVFGNAEKTEKVLHFDFPGMYAQCLKQDLPCGDINYEKINYIKDTGFFFTNGFYFITFRQNMEIPLLPIRYKNKMIFANGEFSGIYWFEEINFFIKLGGQIINVGYKINFSNYKPELREYIEKLESYKNESELKKIIGKSMINSLYGRFGIKNTFYNYDLKLQDEKDLLKIGNIKITRQEVKNNNESNIFIASAITSKARIKLYKGFQDVEREGGRVLYCDTDSIFASFGKKIMIENKQLSEITFDTKLQDTEIEKSIFCSDKEYSVIFKNNKTKTVIKGFKQFLPFTTIFYHFTSNKKLNIKEHYFFKTILENPVQTVEKNLNLNKYSRREWLGGYKRTKPIVFLKNEKNDRY